MVSLSCPNCGATLKVDSNVAESIFVNFSGTYLFTGSEGIKTYTCEHCKSVFERNTAFQEVNINVAFNQSGQTVHGQQFNIVNTGGGAYIKGNVSVKGDFIGRSKL